MSSNVAYLDSLKRSTINRENRFHSQIWRTIFVVGSGIATYYIPDFSTKMIVLGLVVAVIVFAMYSNTGDVSTSSTPARTTAPLSPTPMMPAPVLRRESSNRANSALTRNDILSPIKANRDLGKHQDRQSADWSENFDVQSPQRITQAVQSEMQLQNNNAIAVGPTGTGLMPTSKLYPNANSNYVGKSNVANLGYQFTGSSFPTAYGSPGATAASYNRNTTGVPSAFARANYQQEQTAPQWHAYHSSPTSDNTAMRAVSPSGQYRTGDVRFGASAYEEEDPLDDIVNRVTAGIDRPDGILGSPFADRNLSLNIPTNNSSGMFSPGRASGRSFMTPSGARSRVGAGMTEDRMEHVLNKYLESQEQIVHEVAQELLRLLSQRASDGAAGGVPFLQSQEDLNKLRVLLELQADRQVMQNRTLLGLSELIRYCRSIGINEDMMRKYEAAVAVLQSPNHSSYSNPSTPHAVSAASGAASYGGGHGATSSSGAGVGGPYGMMNRSFNAMPEPVSSSSAFNSTRRSRR